jgi:hypothetical protein
MAFSLVVLLALPRRRTRHAGIDTDRQTSAGRSGPRPARQGGGGTADSIQITLTWASPLDKFKLAGLRLVGQHGVLAVASRVQRKPSKLKVTTTTSSTFAVLHVSHLKKGTLRFAVQAAKVASGEPQATLITQVGQSARR